MDLVFAQLITLATVAVALLATGPARIVLGLGLLLFIPGYVLLAALFARKDGIQPLERVVLSFVLSIALVILLALILNYTPWGVRLEPLVAVLAVFVMVTSNVALFRRRRLPEGERFRPRLAFNVHRLLGPRTPLQVLMTTVFVGSLTAAIVVLVWSVSTPKAGESFTDFYVLDSEGMLTDYPREVTLGSEISLVLGITNCEGAPAEYDVDVLIRGDTLEELGPVSLQDEEEWEQSIAVVPPAAGEDQKMEFLLYKGNDPVPYLSLHLWLDVIEAQ